LNFAKSSRPNDDTIRSVDHLFRHSAGRMTAVLAKAFGLDKFDLIEDAIQDSMIKALRTWPFAGVPEKPEAWLLTVARNRLIDQLRRGTRSEAIGDRDITADSPIDVVFADELEEDVLKMMFACRDPRISPDSQVALTVRAVGGFNVREIASAFLAHEESVAKLITRAKVRLRRSRLEIPPPQELPVRLEPVLKALYLMFNEGYSTSAGERPVRNDLCFEAIRLAKILAAHPVTDLPQTHALTALFLFQTSRIAARFDADGDVLRLSEQDRRLWNRHLIADGLKHLRRSAHGSELSAYHLEAEIASLHSTASSFDGTDWHRIVICYDRLLERRASPVVALNREIARAQVDGPESPLSVIENLAPALNDYPLFHITRGELLSRLGRAVDAEAAYAEAGRFNGNNAMYRFLRQRTGAENS
jgi:RNA polymerase sigma-70 factor (ECF subfamily)